MSAAGRKRVCFVLPSLHGGGAERAAVHVLNALDPATWDRSMFLFEKSGPYLSEVDPGITLTAGTGGSRFHRWNELRRYLAAERPALVMSFLSYVSVLLAARAARSGARVVFNQQTPLSAFLTDADYAWRRPWRRRLFQLVTRLAYRRADAVVATSEGVAEDLVSQFGVLRPRIRVVPNPVNVEEVRRRAAEPLDPATESRWRRPMVITAGRLADAKNYPLLIDAFAELRRRVPATLFILGSGDREDEIRTRIADRGLAGVVVLCGFQSNPWKYISRADVFVLTSRYEGFGNVLIESMACGVPVVATSSPGTKDIVNAGVNGLLIDTHTSTAVAAALERLLTDETLRRKLAAGGRKSATNFALPVIAGKYDQALNRI